MFFTSVTILESLNLGDVSVESFSPLPIRAFELTSISGRTGLNGRVTGESPLACCERPRVAVCVFVQPASDVQRSIIVGIFVLPQ